MVDTKHTLGAQEGRTRRQCLTCSEQIVHKQHAVIRMWELSPYNQPKGIEITA